MHCIGIDDLKNTGIANVLDVDKPQPSYALAGSVKPCNQSSLKAYQKANQASATWASHPLPTYFRDIKTHFHSMP